MDRTTPPFSASEVDTRRGYLDFHRDTMLMKTDGLTQDQLSQTHPPSALTLGGLLEHAAVMRSRAGLPMSLRWILLHMIEEYVRHKGHADLLREAVDATVGE